MGNGIKKLKLTNFKIVSFYKPRSKRKAYILECEIKDEKTIKIIKEALKSENN